MKMLFSVFLFLLVFNAQANTDCVLEHIKCDLCNGKEMFERAAVEIPGVVGCVQCMEFCEKGNEANCQKVASYEILSYIEEKLVISEDMGVALNIAKINPEAAIVFYGLYTLTQKANIPSDSFVTLKSRNSYDEAVAVIQGGEGGKSRGDDYSARAYYRVVKDVGANWLEVRHRIIGENDQAIGQPYQDIKIGLDWVDTDEGGYWKPNGSIAVHQ